MVPFNQSGVIIQSVIKNTWPANKARKDDEIYWVPGPGPSTGGEAIFFNRKKGAKTYLLKHLKIQDLIFQKKSIFESLKVKK